MAKPAGGHNVRNYIRAVIKTHLPFSGFLFFFHNVRSITLDTWKSSLSQTFYDCVVIANAHEPRLSIYDAFFIGLPFRAFVVYLLSSNLSNWRPCFFLFFTKFENQVLFHASRRQLRFRSVALIGVSIVTYDFVRRRERNLAGLNQHQRARVKTANFTRRMQLHTQRNCIA